MSAIKWIFLFVGLAALVLDTAGAKEFIPRLGLSVESHSNVLKTRDDEKKDTIVTPYFGFLFENKSPNMDASVDMEVRNERYTDNAFGSQNLFSVDSFIDWVILPNRFVWAFEDLANSQRIDAFDTSKPDNLQNFNVFTTGPDYYFSSSTYEGLLKLRFGDVYYSKLGQDNRRVIASASVKRLINEYSLFGFNSAASLVDFEEEFFVDYDIGFLGPTYERELPYGTFEISTGMNWVNYDDGAKDSAPMAQFEFEYDSGGGLDVFKLSASSKYSDATLDAYDPLFSRLYDLGVNNPLNANEVAGIGAFESERVEASYTRGSRRVTASLLAYLNNRTALLRTDAEGDVEEVGYGVGLAYQIKEYLSLWASYYESDSDFPEKNSYVTGSTPSIGFDLDLSDKLALSAGTSFGEEKSNEPKRDFSNNIVFLRLEYRGAEKTKE
jgi:hypothetical protein